MATVTPTFLAGILVADRPCLVIGGDREAYEKTRRLLDAGAQVTLVAPSLVAPLAALVAARHVPWHARRFHDDDLAPAPFLVFSSVRDEAFSRSLFARALRDRFLLGCVDQPAHSTFTNVASARLGPVELGFGSGGAVPGLLRRLRDDLVAGLGPDFAAFARYVAAVRAASSPDDRRARVADAIAGFRVEVAVRLPDGWRERWRALERGTVPPPSPDADAAPGRVRP